MNQEVKISSWSKNWSLKISGYGTLVPIFRGNPLLAFLS